MKLGAGRFERRGGKSRCSGLRVAGEIAATKFRVRRSREGFGFCRSDWSKQTEIRHLVLLHPAMAGHGLAVAGVRAVDHAAHPHRRCFAGHAAGQQRQRRCQQSDDDDRGLDAAHRIEATTAERTRAIVSFVRQFAAGDASCYFLEAASGSGC